MLAFTQAVRTRKTRASITASTVWLATFPSSSCRSISRSRSRVWARKKRYSVVTTGPRVGKGTPSAGEPVERGEEQRRGRADGQVGQPGPLGLRVAPPHPPDEQRDREQHRPEAPRPPPPTGPRPSVASGRHRHREPEEEREDGHPSAGPPRLALPAEELEEEAPAPREGTTAPESSRSPERDAHRPAGEPAGDEDAAEEVRQVEGARGEGEDASTRSAPGRGWCAAPSTGRGPWRRCRRGARSGCGCPSGGPVTAQSNPLSARLVAPG